jgi:hypothetical protein
MGFMRWPLAFSLLVIAVLALWSAWKLFRPGASADLRAKVWLDAILFWGAFSLIAGVLGTLVGFILAAQSIEAAGEVSTTLVWGGVKVAMLTSALGTLTLAGAALVWFVLQLRWRLLEAEQAEASA